MVVQFSDIRAGLRERLETISGLRAHTTVPEQVHPPAAFIAPVEWNYHQAMGEPGISRAQFTITVLAAPLDRSTYARAQETLDSYLDDEGISSLRAALEADKTLGGAVTTLTVQRVRDYGVLEWGDIAYVGCVLDVEVWP